MRDPGAFVMEQRAAGHYLSSPLRPRGPDLSTDIANGGRFRAGLRTDTDNRGSFSEGAYGKDVGACIA